MSMPKLVENEETGKFSIALPANLARWVAMQAREQQCTKAFVIRSILNAAKRASQRTAAHQEERELTHV